MLVLVPFAFSSYSQVRTGLERVLTAYVDFEVLGPSEVVDDFVTLEVESCGFGIEGYSDFVVVSSLPKAHFFTFLFFDLTMSN
jgi:hypothetical protein